MIIKCITLISVFAISSAIGMLLSKKYSNRSLELKSFKYALNIFKTKIKYTYEPIPEIFNQISNDLSGNVANIFRLASEKMNTEIAGKAWENSFDLVPCNINEEDKNVLKSLSKLLGKTDIEGQLNEIELTTNFLDMQIEKAEKDRAKNEKLYKTLGLVVGLVIVIILV